jgi:hypothetical protein
MGMFRAVTTVVAATAMVMPLTVAVTAGHAGADEASLVEAAQAYEDRLADAWLGKPIPAPATTADALGLARVAAQKAALTAAGLTVIDASTSIQNSSASRTSTSGRVRALAIRSFTYRALDGDVTPSQEAIPVTYDYVIATASATLATVTETADGDPGAELGAPSVDDSAVPVTDLGVSPDDVGARLGAADGGEGGGSSSCKYQPPTYCVYRGQAASYAAAHACSSCHDPNWHYYSNEDCTNFISTALYVGALWPYHGYRKDTYSWWYSSSSYHANTWTVAGDLYRFIRNSHWADATTSISSLRVGDVLQADWQPDTRIDHTMMVTKKDSSGIYLSYHSNDTVNKPFSKVQATAPRAVYYGWLLHATIKNNW